MVNIDPDDFEVIVAGLDRIEIKCTYKEDGEAIKKQIIDALELQKKELTCPQYRLSVTEFQELKDKADKWNRLNLQNG